MAKLVRHLTSNEEIVSSNLAEGILFLFCRMEIELQELPEEVINPRKQYRGDYKLTPELITLFRLLRRIDVGDSKLDHVLVFEGEIDGQKDIINKYLSAAMLMYISRDHGLLKVDKKGEHSS